MHLLLYDAQYVYWCTTSPNGSASVWIVVGCMLRVRGSVHSSCVRWSMWSNPSAGWPSLASIHCHKLYFSCEYVKVCLAVRWEVTEVAICLQSSKSNHSFWAAVCAFIVIYVSRIFYVGIKVPVFACVSWSSVATGHSTSFICSTVRLVSVSNFPEHDFEWKMCPINGFVWWLVMCRAFHMSRMVESLTRKEWQWACCCVLTFLSGCLLWGLMKLCLVGSFLVRQVLIHSKYVVLFHCKVSHHGTSVKVQYVCSLCMGTSYGFLQVVSLLVEK